MARKGSEYSKHQEGDATVFDVTPAPAPKFTYLLIIGVVVALLGLASLSSGFGIFFLAMAAFAFWYGWFRDMRPKEHKAPSSFRVSPTTVTSGGRTFQKEEIHRFLIRNGITDKELNIERWTSNTNEAAGMAHRALVATVANSVNLETGGKSFVLAGGMDETTAYGLLHDIAKILDMKLS
jgi:hypothetical protein